MNNITYIFKSKKSTYILIVIFLHHIELLYEYSRLMLSIGYLYGDFHKSNSAHCLMRN